MSTIDFQLNSGLGAEYRSHSQQARILTETWIGEHIYCPRCGNPKIMHFPNNRKVADFYCPECQNQYELKSKKETLVKRLPMELMTLLFNESQATIIRIF